MNRQRLVYLTLAALVVLLFAFILNARRNTAHEVGNSLLLPSLAQHLDAVNNVTLRHGAAAANVTLHMQGTQWTVGERNDYPADVVKLRKLLLGLSEAKIAEEKTSNPANFAAIGVDDPGQAGATGTEIAWAGSQPAASVIVGKASGQGNFVRRGGENVSYLIEPSLSIDATPAAWIDTRVLDVPTASIQSIEFKPTTGPGYVLKRATPDGAFALNAVPVGRKALEGAALAPSPNTLANLTAEDVATAASVDFTQAPQVIITLSEGATLTATGAVSGDKHWITLKSSKDTALNTKLDGRAFALQGYRYDAVFRPLDQLLVPLPPPPAKDASPGKNGSVGKQRAAPASSPVAPSTP